MPRSKSRTLGLLLLACAAVLGVMDFLEWRESGRIWIVGTMMLPICGLLGPWWLVVGRPADTATGLVPRWIVRGEAAVTLVGLALGLAALAWTLWPR